MIVDLDTISENMKRIQHKLGEAKRTVPSQPKPLKSVDEDVDEEVDDELEKPYYKYQEEDTKFITKCYKYLRKLGLVESQYQFSEQFLNKNKYYFGMILCEQRHPSVDSLHNLIRNISLLNDGVTKQLYLDRLYEEGQVMITERLLKYF